MHRLPQNGPPPLPPGEGGATLDPFDDASPLSQGFEPDVVSSPPAFPWFENHGYFRLRHDWFDNLSLSTYGSRNAFTSGQHPPLTEDSRNNVPTSQIPEGADPKLYQMSQGATWITSANLRFRWDPTLHLAENVRIRAQIDMLDNLVLGSTPDGLYQRFDLPMVGFTGGQAPPESGRNGALDSVRVKRAWGEWKTPLGLLLFGRMGSHWGLGMVANNGNCEDCDFGDTWDRVMFITRALSTYVALGYDFAASGATTATLAQPFGQDRNLDDADDIDQFVFAVFRKPMSDEEKEARIKDLDRLRVPVLDGGFYGVYRSQEMTTENALADGKATGSLPEAQLTDEIPSAYLPDDRYWIRNRGISVWIPDVWGRLEWRPKRGHVLRVEAEAAMIYGSIDDVALEAPERGVEAVSRDVLMWGGVLQADYRLDSVRFGLEVGLASGGRQYAFGVHDGLAIPDVGGGDGKAGSAAAGGGLEDEDVNSFRFDRDYVVDLILFREIIGAVTNALYVKPSFEYDILRTSDSTLGLQADVIYARALVAEVASGDSNSNIGTPSGEPDYGLELDATLFFRQNDRFSLQLAYGIFFPFAAFDLVSPATEAETAQTIQGRIALKF